MFVSGARVALQARAVFITYYCDARCPLRFPLLENPARGLTLNTAGGGTSAEQVLVEVRLVCFAMARVILGTPLILWENSRHK